ncbi:hypothetical protein Q1695_011826 [Nippostrongylus brasiliensis]|nr:hypothetical protein Q1695_011826 [Nippostrongylus brasiliensis]
MKCIMNEWRSQRKIGQGNRRQSFVEQSLTVWVEQQRNSDSALRAVKYVDHGGVTKPPFGAGNNPWAMPNQPRTNHDGVTKAPLGAGNNPWAMPNQPKTHSDGETGAPFRAGNVHLATSNEPAAREDDELLLLLLHS